MLLSLSSFCTYILFDIAVTLTLFGYYGSSHYDMRNVFEVCALCCSSSEMLSISDLQWLFVLHISSRISDYVFAPIDCLLDFLFAESCRKGIFGKKRASSNIPQRSNSYQNGIVKREISLEITQCNYAVRCSSYHSQFTRRMARQTCHIIVCGIDIFLFLEMSNLLGAEIIAKLQWLVWNGGFRGNSA